MIVDIPLSFFMRVVSGGLKVYVLLTGTLAPGTWGWHRSAALTGLARGKRQVCPTNQMSFRLRVDRRAPYAMLDHGEERLCLPPSSSRARFI
jgi:hypothetical protein